MESFPACVLQVLGRDFQCAVCVHLLTLQWLGDEEEYLLRQMLCQLDHALFKLVPLQASCAWFAAHPLPQPHLLKFVLDDAGLQRLHATHRV